MRDNQPFDVTSPADTVGQAPATFPEGSIVQLIAGDPTRIDAVVVTVQPASLRITADAIVAVADGVEWTWPLSDLRAVVHGADDPWTMLLAPAVEDFGVAVAPDRADEFRAVLGRLPGLDVLYQASTVDIVAPPPPPVFAGLSPTSPFAPPLLPPVPVVVPSEGATGIWPQTAELPVVATAEPVVEVHAPATVAPDLAGRTSGLAGLDARNISAWFGPRQVLDRVSLSMRAGEVTALIGPSGCGKSTFLRILNRMHEMIPAASMAGEVMLDGHDVYDAQRKLTDARREIGMVFQKPNPFPAMSIYDNVLASLRLTGTKATTAEKDAIVETCLSKAGLWNEVKDRLRQPGGGLSGGQQQRLCIARALAIRPRVLLMDEPCSALDPTSTRRIEETIRELVAEVTIVIVTHNMQQAARVSHQCAFFLAEHGTPGVIVEHGPTEAMFGWPQDSRTYDYVNGRFG